MSDTKYWGSVYDEAGPISTPNVSKDIEFAMSDFKKIILNEADDDSSSELEKIVVPPLNPLVLHAINLHEYRNTSLDLLKLNKYVKSEDNSELTLPTLSSCSDFGCTGLNFRKSDFGDFSNGNEVNLCELNSEIVREILKKATATLFAHLGYEGSEEGALGVLVDVLDEFLRKISSRVKSAMDEEMLETSGFSHVIERVLTELGMGGVHALKDYYEARVVNYVKVLESRCRKLNKDYQSLSETPTLSPVDKINPMVRVKVEEEDVVEVENPEVHFTSIEGDVSFSILETGYQLLNSLEAEANLQNIGDSVDSVDSVAVDDASHLSPYNKIKRYK